MCPVVLGSRMAWTHPLAVEKVERLGLGFGSRSPSLSLLVVQYRSPVGWFVFWFFLGNPYWRLLRVETFPFPLSVAPVSGLGFRV